MSKSQSSKGHHKAAAGSANLAFGIDHILSSSAAAVGSPMKQVQQAMASVEQHSHFDSFRQQHQHQQQQHQQHQHLNQYHQQQAAAMQLMLNSAGLPASGATTASTAGLNNQQDFSNSAALNEQLALLAAASQHQQQQQHHHHLMNPTALAAAAQAQQHLQWQYQQQLMTAAAAAAAATAAASQQRQAVASSPLNLGALSALSSLNALAAAQSQNPSASPSSAASNNTGNSSPTTNHLLSCFMASMLLQQQQQQAQKQASQMHQQQQQQLLPSRDQQEAMMMAGHQMSPFMPSNNGRAPLSSGPGLGGQLGGALNESPPGVGNNKLAHRSPPGSTATSAGSPIKQFFGEKSLPSLQDHHELKQRFNGEPINQSPLLPTSATNINLGCRQARRPSDRAEPPSKQSSSGGKNGSKITATPSSNMINTTNTTNSNISNHHHHHHHHHHNHVDATDADDECGTALSSLKNFVSNMAPILDEFGGGGNGNISHKQRTSASQRALMSTSHQLRISNQVQKSNNASISSGSESSMLDDEQHQSNGNARKAPSRNSAGGGAVNDSNILEAVASALEGANGNKSANPPATPAGGAKTINTAIAKVAPGLIKEQPAWVFCTRYSDRPSSGPRTRRAKSKDKKPRDTKLSADEKRPRTAFTGEQLERLRQEFQANSYLDEKRRKSLADNLGLNENQIKIWFQNKRAKMKKQSNQPNPLRGLLVAGGLYNHSTATSDCSESYANGQADDVGNRAMRDFDGGDVDDADDDDNALLDNSDDEHHGEEENRRTGNNATNNNHQPKPAPKVNHSFRNLARDELNDKQQLQLQRQPATGVKGEDESALPRKRLPVSNDLEETTGGDDRNNNSDLSCGNGNSSPVGSIKRARLELHHHHTERLHDEEPVISVS